MNRDGVPRFKVDFIYYAVIADLFEIQVSNFGGLAFRGDWANATHSIGVSLHLWCFEAGGLTQTQSSVKGAKRAGKSKLTRQALRRQMDV